MCSVDDACDDWGVSICRTASAHSVPSLELSSQRNELLRFKEFDTRLSHEMRLSSGNLYISVFHMLPMYLYCFYYSFAGIVEALKQWAVY